MGSYDIFFDAKLKVGIIPMHSLGHKNLESVYQWIKEAVEDGSTDISSIRIFDYDARVMVTDRVISQAEKRLKKKIIFLFIMIQFQKIH